MSAGFLAVFSVVGPGHLPPVGVGRRWTPWATIVIGVGARRARHRHAAGVRAGGDLAEAQPGRTGAHRPVDVRVRRVVRHRIDLVRVPAVHRRGGRDLPSREPAVQPRRLRRLLARHDPRARSRSRSAWGWPARAWCRWLRRALPYVTRASGGLLIIAGAYLAHYGWYEMRVRAGRGVELRGRRRRHRVVVIDRELGLRRRPDPARAAARARRWSSSSPPPSASAPAAASSSGPVRRAARPRGRRGGHRAAVVVRVHGLPRREPRGGHGRDRSRSGRRVQVPRCTRCASPATCAGTSRPSRSHPTTHRPWRRFLAHVDVAVAVHGYGRAGHVDDAPARRPQPGPRGPRGRAPPGGHAGLHGGRRPRRRCPRELRGVHRANPVNRCRGGRACSSSCPPRPRSRTVPMWAELPEDEPIPHGLDLIAALAAAARTWRPAPTA